MRTRKERFVNAFEAIGYPTKLVVAFRLPSGAIELIINTEDISEKFMYYCSAYDDNMTMRNNNSIQIINWMFV